MAIPTITQNYSPSGRGCQCEDCFPPLTLRKSCTNYIYFKIQLPRGHSAGEFTQRSRVYPERSRRKVRPTQTGLELQIILLASRCGYRLLFLDNYILSFQQDSCLFCLNSIYSFLIIRCIQLFHNWGKHSMKRFNCVLDPLLLLWPSVSVRGISFVVRFNVAFLGIW